MTSHLEPFGDPPGYQFQDGDEWLHRPPGAPRGFWVRLTARRDAARFRFTIAFRKSNAHSVGQRVYDRNPGVPVYYLPTSTISSANRIVHRLRLGAVRCGRQPVLRASEIPRTRFTLRSPARRRTGPPLANQRLGRGPHGYLPDAQFHDWERMDAVQNMGSHRPGRTGFRGKLCRRAALETTPGRVCRDRPADVRPVRQLRRSPAGSCSKPTCRCSEGSTVPASFTWRTEPRRHGKPRSLPWPQIRYPRSTTTWKPNTTKPFSTTMRLSGQRITVREWYTLRRHPVRSHRGRLIACQPPPKQSEH